jgi:hypothetical protein
LGGILEERLDKVFIEYFEAAWDLVGVFTDDPSDRSASIWFRVLSNFLDKIFDKFFILLRETTEDVSCNNDSFLKSMMLPILHDRLDNLNRESHRFRRFHFQYDLPDCFDSCLD